MAYDMQPATTAPIPHLEINYESSPTLHKLHRSRAIVRGVRGPVGSGKSVGCVLEVLRMAMHQAPDANGIRPTRFAISRNTYGELKTTTIKTWQQWIPESVCPLVYDSPIRGVLRFPHPDGKTRVESEIYFMSLDRPKDVRKVLSLELTGGWINEAREVPYGLVIGLRQRCGRYPEKKRVPLTQYGLLLDTNPPDSDHWWYQLAEEHRVPDAGDDPDMQGVDIADFEFFCQPPALLKSPSGYVGNQAAENVQNQQLGFKYWLNQVAGAKAEWIKVYLLGDYGFVIDGKLVYDEYNDAVHCAKAPLRVLDGLPLVLGFDFGLTPACVVCQLSPRGQLRVIDEFVSQGMGIKQFARWLAPQMALKYSAHPIATHMVGSGDPAGAADDQVDNEVTCFKELNAAGFSIEPAPSNDWIPRREAVAFFMTRMDCGVPSFMLSPNCRVLRKGFLGGYNYRRMQVPGRAVWADKPVKDQYSHPQDALQYAAMRVLGGNLSIRKPSRPREMRDWRA